MDERYREERNTVHISKWLRKSIKHYDNFDNSLEGLRSFFEDVKEWTTQKGINTLETSDLKEEDIPSTTKNVLSREAAKKRINTSKISEVIEEETSTKQNTFSKGATKKKITKKVVSKNIIANEKGRQLPKSLIPVRNNDAIQYTQSTYDIIEVKQFANADENKTTTCREYVDLECSPQKDLRSDRKSLASTADSSEQFVVKRNPGISDTDNISMSSPAVLCKEENSNSSIVEATNDLSDQRSALSASIENSDGAISQGTCAMEITPERINNSDIHNLKPETEISLNMSVNSHTQRRRKPVCSLFPNYQMDQFQTPDGKPHHGMRSTCASNRSIESDFNAECAECDNGNDSKNVLVHSSSKSFFCSNTAMDKRLHICCSFCKTSLGLPENNYLVTCSLTSSTKVYVTSFFRNGLDRLSVNESESVRVVVSDILSVDQRLYSRHTNDINARNQGTWCAKDGCVFSTIFCPFCIVPENVLGLRVMATDAPNVQLLNKILFYFDHLEIKNLEAPKKDEPCLRGAESDHGQSIGSELCQVPTGCHNKEVADVLSIDKFSYVKQEQDSGGWRTTKSKLKLPNKGYRS